MRTLIIPCAGSHEIDGKPLFLNRHPDGNIIAKKSICGIFLENYDRVIFTILKETDEKYNAATILKENIANSEVVILERKTSGPAESIYRTLEEANIVGEFAVRDSHAYIKLEKDYSGNFITGLNLTEFEKTIDNLRSKSFIVLNEQNQILDVVEKHFCSDVISVGFYGFKNAQDFRMAFEHLRDPNYHINKLYLSHIISYLIGYKQRIFHAVMTSEFEDWSTKVAWQKNQKKFGLCFMSLDNIELNKELIEKIKMLNQSGNSFIMYSSRNTDLEQLGQQLKGAIIVGLVNNCPNTKFKVFLDKAEDIENLLLEVCL